VKYGRSLPICGEGIVMGGARRDVRAFGALLALGAVIAGSIVATAPAASATSSSVVISQVYTAGGNTGASFLNDFVELHNNGSAAVDVTGYSIQYVSATGSFLTGSETTLSGIMQPGGYLLVGEASGGASGASLPSPDVSGIINFSASAGKVALANTTTLGSGFVDLVGYGATANLFEGSGPAPAPGGSGSSVIRTAPCRDTDDNAVDFTTATPPVPHNSAASGPCGASGSTPPPDVPEAPLGAGLLGLAAVAFGAGFFVLRRRAARSAA
jgi:uncharacterized protein